MKSLTTWVVLIIAIAAAGAGGYWLGHRGTAPDKDEANSESGGEPKIEPIATVTVTPLLRTTISADIIAYGTVVAPASEISVVSVPFESRVTKMLVAPGETVTAGQPLVEVEGSAATSLLVEEARNTQAAAERDLEAVKQRYEQKLATNADLYTAENNVRTAQGRFKSLQQGGAGAPAQLKAAAAGIVSKVDVQIGQVVPIGSPLVEVVAQNRIEVHLGVEPEEAELLKAGQAVKLQPIDDADAKPITGKVRLIGQRVDPATRLVDVLVSLPPQAKLMLEGFVAGQLTTASADAIVAPREAVLPEEGGYTLYTVKDGKAVKHSVHVGLENDRDVQVVSDDLHAGDLAVVVGNYELEDGSLVEVQHVDKRPSTSPAATREGDQ